MPTNTSNNNVYDRLKELNITLPTLPAPAAAYVPFVQTGNLVFVSGHVSRKDGRVWAGQLGAEVSIDDGRAAARAVAIDLLATLHAATGDLSRVTRIVKLLGLVNSTSQFTDQPKVINGASELFVELFADRGKHARSAIGVAQLPMGACVEIEMVVEIA